jgi:hypothetical protein
MEKSEKNVGEISPKGETNELYELWIWCDWGVRGQ